MTILKHPYLILGDRKCILSYLKELLQIGLNLNLNLIFFIVHVGIPFGFQTIIWTFARHPVSRCLTFPYGSTWVVLWLLFF